MAAPVTEVLSIIDETKRYNVLMAKIYEANLEDPITTVHRETGESSGYNITGNEDTQGNCPTEQSSDRAAGQSIRALDDLERAQRKFKELEEMILILRGRASYALSS
ncbi:hypothetical protein J6590_070298 [Homalodisca vitripennis]|nr:hypothetical protein J6590_070298 [Homalodisca vitripennis]